MARKRILLVDDEKSFTNLLKLNLEETGSYEVRVENWPEDARAAAKEFKPHLILLDIIMPRFPGGDVAADIKADPALKDTPIVFLTATVSQNEAGTGGLNSGGSLFLAKPVSVENLIQTIVEHLPKTPEEQAE